MPPSWGYRVAIATEWPFSATPILLSILLPESPALLLRRERTASAWLSFVKLHDQATALQSEGLFEDMRRAIREERRNASKARYIDCFRGTNRRRTFIVVFASILPELFGLSLLVNATYFVQQLGMGSNLSFVVQLVGVLCAMISAGVSFFTLLRYGRRKHILISLGVVGALWLGMGVVGIFPRTETVAWAGCALMVLIITTASLGVWPASYVVSSETSSLTLRAKTSGVGWLLGGLVRAGFDFGMPYLYNSDGDSLDLGGKTGFVFLGTCVVSFALSWYVIPGLKGRSALEIDRFFEKRVNARRFKMVEWTSLGGEDKLVLQASASADSVDVAWRRGPRAVHGAEKTVTQRNLSLQ